MKHFIAVSDATRPDLDRIFELSFNMRRQRRAGEASEQILAGRTIAMIFEKPSLRTRASVEQAVHELGGYALNLQGAEVGMGKREASADVARVLGGIVHGIAARVYEHKKLQELTRHAGIPVINLLSDRSHPCQALADIMTAMDEFGTDLSGRTMVFVGDGNNVARSAASICARMGMRFVLSSPPQFVLDDAFLADLAREVPQARVEQVEDPRRAVADADVIYTDTWVSMGQEAQMEKRRAAFGGYQVNRQLLDAAPDHAIVLHCLPAYRGFEITDEAIEGPRSRVFAQAHNRLHAQKGLLAVLLAGADEPGR
jgi:ornithine carbamoyltransferase